MNTSTLRIDQLTMRQRKLLANRYPDLSPDKIIKLKSVEELPDDYDNRDKTVRPSFDEVQRYRRRL